MGEQGTRFVALRQTASIVRATVEAGSHHDVGVLAPAMAYSIIVSLAPATLVMNQVFGGAIGPAQALVDESPAAGTLTPEALFGELASSGSQWAPIVIVALALFGASTLFALFVRAIVRIWGQDARHGAVRAYARSRVFGLLLLIVAGVGLFASAVLGNALASVTELVESLGVELGWLDPIINSRFGFDFGFAVVLFVVAFTTVPPVRPHVRDTVWGSVVTAAAYALGQSALGIYLSSASRFEALGAFGALLAFLVWAYYTALIILWGAEFTFQVARVRACARGGADAAPYACATPTSSADVSGAQLRDRAP